MRTREGDHRQMKTPHPAFKTLKRELAEEKLSRREFVRMAALLGVRASVAYTVAGEITGAGLMPQAHAAFPRGGTLRLGMRVIEVNSPHTFSWIWDSNVARQVAEYLTKTGHDNVTRPYLLESWFPSEDLRTWTLNVRQGIHWHNGRAFTAEDVIWNIQRVLSESTGSSIVGLMKGYMLEEYEEAGELHTRLWDANAIEKVDDYTVRLNCRVAQLAVPEHLFHYPFLILDPAEDGHFGPGSNGTGAFDLIEHEVGNRSVLRARNDYWGEGPYVEVLEFIDLGDDPSGEIDAMASKKLHGVDLVDIVQVEAFKLMEHLVKYQVPTASTAVARGKVSRKPFNDPRVRKALRLAIDPVTIQRLVHFEGALTRGTSSCVERTSGVRTVAFDEA